MQGNSPSPGVAASRSAIRTVNMPPMQPAITVPPEAERLRDALHEVTFWSVSLLRDAEKAKHLLDLGVEPKADEWPPEDGDGDDDASPAAIPSNELTDANDYGWRRLLPILREDLRESWAAHDEAQAAIAVLPPQIARLLDEPGDRRWTVRVRSTLDSLGRWHSGTRPRRTKHRAYPPDVSALIRLLRDSLPDWSGLLDSIQGFQTDLFALRGEAPPELPGSASGSIPAACAELLKWLEAQPDGRAPLLELPEQCRHAHLLTFSDARGLIEFGQRNHGLAGGELQLKNGWSFGSVTQPGFKPMAEALKEEAAANPEHPDLRIHVRLTHKGRIALAEHAFASGVGAGGDPNVRTPLEMDILHTLARSPHGAMHQADIAEACKASKHTIRKAIARLESQGLVAKPEGKLRKGRGITEKGRECLEQHAPVVGGSRSPKA
jgi:predicted transcriptional regulator